MHQVFRGEGWLFDRQSGMTKFEITMEVVLWPEYRLTGRIFNETPLFNRNGRVPDADIRGFVRDSQFIFSKLYDGVKHNSIIYTMEMERSASPRMLAGSVRVMHNPFFDRNCDQLHLSDNGICRIILN